MDDKTNVVFDNDLSRLKSILNDLSNQVSGVTQDVEGLLKRVENGEVKTSKGVSLLEVKYHLLLSYLTDLTYIISCKTKGQSINGDPAVMRLAENRTVLEKIRPIDQKLTYQVDKLLKVAATGVPAENNPLRFKPNPAGLVSKLQEDDDNDGSSDDDDDDDEKEKSDKQKKYVPPKLSAMYYDGDETIKERRERQLEKAKKRALSSQMIRELRAEYYDGPEEVTESASMHRLKEDKESKERRQYEEENFLRLPVTKKDKGKNRNLGTIASLDSITKFDNISALDRDLEGEMDEPMRKKGKMSSKLRKAKKKMLVKSLKKRRRKFYS